MRADYAEKFVRLKLSATAKIQSAFDGIVVYLIRAQVRPVWPHHRAMIGNDLIKNAVSPDAGQTFVITIRIAIKNSVNSIAENDVESVIRQCLHFFHPVHHHNGASFPRPASPHPPSYPHRCIALQYLLAQLGEMLKQTIMKASASRRDKHNTKNKPAD